MLKPKEFRFWLRIVGLLMILLSILARGSSLFQRSSSLVNQCSKLKERSSSVVNSIRRCASEVHIESRRVSRQVRAFSRDTRTAAALFQRRYRSTSGDHGVVRQGSPTSGATRGPEIDSQDELKETTSIEQTPQVYSPIERRIRAGAVGLYSSFGFISSAGYALITDRAQFRRWKPMVEALRNFLKTSGIDLELSKTWNVRLFDNIIILGRIQNILLAGKDRRDLALHRNPPSDIPTTEEALRYMRYATAVYGDSMIRAAEMDVTGKFTRSVPAITRKRISGHIGVPEADIVLMDVDYGGDSNHLRHFVAVDHVNRKVVLSIRGTFTLSEIFVDVAGFTREFCGGEAHSEMANMAERVWQVAGATVLGKLRENEGYEFIITGHSLGGGTASLLNILCHRNDRALVEGRPTRCFAFAAPPVYTPLDFVPQAIKACTNFIQADDLVPFLSVDSVRHLSAAIRVIDEQQMPWSERLRLVTGYRAPDIELIQKVHRASHKRLAPKKGAPLLFIPAAATLWLEETERSGNFNLKVCDPRRLATLSVHLGPGFLQDHFPSRYEHALHNLK